MKLKIKITLGYRPDQQFTIDAEEAHKAYYIFLHPDNRTVFKSGLAVIGKNIQAIEPDYNSTMGWNPSHKLTDDDWNEIRSEGVDKDLALLLEKAKQYSLEAEKNREILNKEIKMIAEGTSIFELT